MATRSTDAYLPHEGQEAVGVCTGCKAISWGKRWFADGDEAVTLPAGSTPHKVVCPACQRMQDNNPAGIVTFSGDYLLQHEELILNAVKNIEAKSRAKNPLSRIMEIGQEGNVLTIRTTDEKLAERLGREIYKSHSGKLGFQWSEDENFVRVSWTR
ncbi:hypothetical protein GEOBC_01685 [Geobacteraceae bacterium]|nr:hypothetical protein GEOBC_01685 [Geobacteraceae bacterium]